MINGDMGTQPLNGGDAKAVLELVAKWSKTSYGPAVVGLVKALRLAGYTSVPEKGRAPAWAEKLPAKMPEAVYGDTDEDGVRIPGLYDLMIAHPDKMGEISDRLLAQYGDEKGIALYDEAERDALHTMRVESLRIDLYNAIHEIRQNALKAEAAIVRLETEYDVEITEYPEAEYLKSFIAGIRRDGAAAYRFLPFDENGDLK